MRRSRRVAIVAIASVVAVTCVALGLWQLRRLDDRRAANARIIRAGARHPDLVNDPSDLSRLEPFERVIVSGRYEASDEVLVYGRSLDGRPGHYLVTPLEVLDGGARLLVLRGWVPFEIDEAPAAGAEPPDGVVTIRGGLLQGEEGGEPPDARGIIRRLDVDAIARSLPYDVAPLIVRLREQQPPVRGLPVPVPPPELSEGPHLSYAIQWFAFAAIALVGTVVLLRRDRNAPAVTPGP